MTYQTIPRVGGGYNVYVTLAGTPTFVGWYPTKAKARAAIALARRQDTGTAGVDQWRAV